MEGHFVAELWTELIWPLLRIVFLISAGLVVANFIEALNWAERLAMLARPLIRYGRFSAVTGASFSLAFFSGVSANTMLAEAYDQGMMGKRELVLANLLNSLPRFFLHLPTVFFLTAPLIKGAAVAYVAITFSAALLLTLAVVLGGRVLLGGDGGAGAPPVAAASTRTTARQALEKSIKRFRKRIRHILLFMVPVYVLFFLFGRFGVFARLEELAARSWLLDWLNPKSVGIVILHVTAEFSAGVAAAGALLADNSLTRAEVVMALLVGNILAAPIRAARHQFPYYVGIFSPRLALELVGVSQAARIVSLVLVGLGYYVVVG